MTTGVGMADVQQVAEAFSSVADTFGAEVDPLALARRLVDHSVRLTAADAAGLMLVDARGRLRTVAVSDERAELWELFGAQAGEGPSTDCLRSGSPFRAPRLEEHVERWPRFTPLAAALDMRGAHAVPVRAGDGPVGVITLLLGGTGELPRTDLALVSSLADVTVGAMLRWRAEPQRRSDILTRVQSVISSKALVETATGMLAARDDLDIPGAARALAEYSARTGLRTSVVAQRLLSRALTPEEVLAAVSGPGSA